MLAKAVDAIPEGDFLYEPKWDGFRTIVFRDGDDVELGSRNEKPMTRYFPELIETMRKQLPDKCVLDGEIVIMTDHGLEFDLLSMRIHPAESRVNKLSVEIPASFVAFDCLAVGERDLTSEPFAVRRAELEKIFASIAAPLFVTPCSTDVDVANLWFEKFEGAGLDGVVAKPSDVKYVQDKRVMFKIKHSRTADCVVAGFREHKTGGVGSLLLGLFDDEGVLHHVGVCSAFSTSRRKELEKELAPYRSDLTAHPWANWIEDADDPSSRQPGMKNRWNSKKDMSWEPLRPELVVEVKYDHMQGDRFRHATQFVRWRDDRKPESCTYAQLEQPVSAEVQAIFEALTK
jgi:ATP-dependent DNA ligase